MPTTGYTNKNKPFTVPGTFEADKKENIVLTENGKTTGNVIYLGFTKNGGDDCANNINAATRKCQNCGNVNSISSPSCSSCNHLLYYITSDTAGCHGNFSDTQGGLTAGKIVFTLAANTNTAQRTVTYKYGNKELFKVKQDGVAASSTNTFTLSVRNVPNWAIGNIEFNGIGTYTETDFILDEPLDIDNTIDIDLAINMNDEMYNQSGEFEFEFTYNNMPCTNVKNYSGFTSSGRDKVAFMYDNNASGEYNCGNLRTENASNVFYIRINYQGSTGNITFKDTPSFVAEFGQSGNVLKTFTISFSLHYM